MKLLDEAEERTILLLAPAGYGKTTLARQWAKTLNSSIWITLTPAHRDVATLAEDLAAGIDAAGGEATRFVTEYVRAQNNPQRAWREIGSVLASRLTEARVQWLVLDDYQEAMTSPETEEMIEAIEERSQVRLFVATRLRPSWATERRLIYGDIVEVGREQLAMTPAESRELLGGRPAIDALARRAEGWPAVLGLAAVAGLADAPKSTVPASLHRYLADELFQTASTKLQEELLDLCLLGDLSAPTLERHLGSCLDKVVDEARALGFDSGEGDFELHPLLREFLLRKLGEEPDSEQRVRRAISENLELECWDKALELVMRFNLLDLVDPVLEAAFKPLVRTGRFGTLAAYARQASSAPTFPPASVEIAQAEIALREGNLELARDISARVLPRLENGHALRSRAAAILGHSCFLLADFPGADSAFVAAKKAAQDEVDETEALHGLALANVFGERADAENSVKALEARRRRSPNDLLRFVTAEISLHRFVHPLGLRSGLRLEEARLLLPQVEDPRSRSAFTYSAACALAQRGDYLQAKEWLALCLDDISTFGLDFTLPYVNWTSAQISLGLRRFGEAERSIQSVEDGAARAGDRHHELNARSLRARLLLETGRADDAVECLRADPDVPLIPSWRGEYFATRALALACAGDKEGYVLATDSARSASGACEIRLLLDAAAAVARADDDPDLGTALILRAEQSDVWDPVVCVLRACRSLADNLAKDRSLRPLLENLYRRTQDLALARRAGFRIRATESPHDVLTPREYEVLGLIAQGYRNRDISGALFIAESTTKVYVRHILEKLGVRTRAEAVARLEMFS